MAFRWRSSASECCRSASAVSNNTTAVIMTAQMALVVPFVLIFLLTRKLERLRHPPLFLGILGLNEADA
jgi:hypothetical protein